jgi:hypothetical protein
MATAFDAERFRIEDFPVTTVRAYLHTTIAAMAIAFGALSAPANATVSTPFGSINAGGFGISTPFGGVSTPFFGLGNAGPGAGGYYTGFGVSTPWGGVSTPFFGLSDQQALSVRTPFGGFSGPGFGIGFGPVSANFGGFGLGNAGPGAGGYYTGFGLSPWGGYNPYFGLNEQQALSVRTPWGGASMPGFGIGMPCGFVGPCMPSPLGFGVAGPQQALSVSTPWGGFSGPGFGISTPWGGMNMGGFGIGGQQPQVMPIYLPNPY